MTTDQEKKNFILPEIFVPVLAFGSTLAGVLLYSSGVEFEFQYAAIGGFIASCLLAYLAWIRAHKDIVALSTPIYGLIFLITPIDYTGGVALQLVYAAGLTILAARLRSRFGDGAAARAPASGELSFGPLRTYVESTAPPLASLVPACGDAAADAFLAFSAGEYEKAAEISHAANCHNAVPEGLGRAFSVLRQHAELMKDRKPRPPAFQKFLPADDALLAKPLTLSGDPDREFEVVLDNALLLLFSAAWHASPKNRPLLLASQGFAGKIIGN